MHLVKFMFRSWKRAFPVQILSVLALSFSFVALSMSIFFERSITPVVDRIKNEQVVTVYVKGGDDVKSASAMADSIRLSIGAQAIRIQAGEPAQFLKDIALQNAELAKQIQGLGPEMNNLLPRYVTLQGRVTAEQIRKIDALSGVERIESSRDRYRPIIESFSSIRRVVVSAEAGFALIIFLIIAYIAQVNAHLQKDVASLLRLWGATPFQARLPTLLSCAFTGLVTGVFAAGIWMLLQPIVLFQIRNFSPVFASIPGPITATALLIAGAATLLSTLAGLVQSIRTQ